MDRIERELARFRHELDEKITTVNAKLTEVKVSVNNLLDKLEFEFRVIYAEQEQVEKWRAAVEARLEALEKRQPPAA